LITRFIAYPIPFSLISNTLKNQNHGLVLDLFMTWASHGWYFILGPWEFCRPFHHQRPPAEVDVAEVLSSFPALGFVMFMARVPLVLNV